MQKVDYVSIRGTISSIRIFFNSIGDSNKTKSTNLCYPFNYVLKNGTQNE